MDPAHIIEGYSKFLPILIGVSVLWIGGWVWASAAYRRSRGKPIVFTGVEGAAYVETTASGHSHRTWYTRLGGANRLLVVAVAGRRLIIRPRFPFNLLFLPEIYGLEYEVPVDQITSVQPRKGRLGQVDVQFRDATNDVQSVTLYLRDPDRFIESLGKRPE
jgi:hypothetical protein